MVYCLIQNRNSLQQFSDRYCLISADHLNLPYLNKMDLMKWPIFSLLEPEFACKIKMACVYGMYSIVLLFYIPKGSFQHSGVGIEIRDSFTIMHFNVELTLVHSCLCFHWLCYLELFLLGSCYCGSFWINNGLKTLHKLYRPLKLILICLPVLHGHYSKCNF